MTLGRDDFAMALFKFRVVAAFIFLAACAVALCLTSCSLLFGQASFAEQEVRVHDLPLLTARSADESDLLAASLEMIFNDKRVCCRKNSALEDRVQSADPTSLQDIASKLAGKHLLRNGRVIMVTAECLTPDQVKADHLIHMLAEQHAPLMIWKSHLYVVDGVTYVASIEPSGDTQYVTHKFLLQDAQFSDLRRQMLFDRLTEDVGKVQGLLFLWVTQK